jgi:uncharacterized small protein (DUF1192 family)
MFPKRPKDSKSGSATSYQASVPALQHDVLDIARRVTALEDEVQRLKAQMGSVFYPDMPDPEAGGAGNTNAP